VQALRSTGIITCGISDDVEPPDTAFPIDENGTVTPEEEEEV